MKANKFPRDAGIPKAAVILGNGVNGQQGGAGGRVTSCRNFCPFPGASSRFLTKFIYTICLVFYMVTNYEFFMKTDLSNYIGKWIAICREKIVSSGDNPKKEFADPLVLEEEYYLME